jgi:mannose-6-phosphate isomerase-like protein (cupin superfamily)
MRTASLVPRIALAHLAVIDRDSRHRLPTQPRPRRRMLAGMKFAFLAAFVCLALVTVQVSVRAADPVKPMFWSAAQNKDFDKKATANLNDERHLGTERLMDSAFVAFRNGSGEAELHVKQADLLLIRSGSGTVLVGGEMIEGKSTGPDEIRGKSITGGTRFPVVAGDTLYIPANTVHQFLMEPGQSFTAMVIKITPRQ